MTVAASGGKASTRGHAIPVHARGPWVVTLGVVAVALAAFWPSLVALADLWSHPERRTYQHGYLIAVIALWLLFRERGSIAGAAAAPSYPMLMLAALGGIAWAVAWNAGLQVLHFLIWPAVLWLALTGMLGLRAGRVLLLPVGFIYFAMPVWDAMTPALQTATVLANRALGIVGNVPMIIEGNIVHIPEGSFEIAGGCSGLNYLIVGLAISTLLGEVNRNGLRRRLLLIAIGGAMAIVSNWTRVFVIIFAGHVSDMTHYLVRVDHYNFGWVLYAFVLAGFFMIARRLPDDPDVEERVEAGTARWRASAPLIGASAVAMAFGPFLARGGALIDRHGSESTLVGMRALDFDADDRWRALPASGDWIPVFPGADSETLVEFDSGDAVVTVYTATYLRQSQGRELVGHESRVEGLGRGRFVTRGRRAAATATPVEIIEGEWSDASGGRSLLWWVYQVGDRRFTSPLAAQLWYGARALTGPPVSSVVALRTACRGNCDEARPALERFAATALPRLLSELESSGN